MTEWCAHFPAAGFRLEALAPASPLVFLSVPALFLVVAFLASSIPARRGLNIDPIVALSEN